MEDQGAERSSSPSGSEDVDSDGESKHDDTENGKESDENEEDGKDDDSDSEASDASREEGVENPGKSGETLKCEDLKNMEVKKDSMKEFGSAASESLGGYGMDGECYPLADLPLEVITTVEPTNYAYPVLKNMSNGVLTHRNIFTEFERSVLVNIINKYRNIVDTRSRTREIYLEKQNVWQQIVEEYNGTENIMVRTEKELRKCWDNMKYRAKQAEKEMVKTEEAGVEDGSVQVKVEPPDQDTNTFTSDYEPGGEELSWPGGEGVGDEDREPALKRARQESPKLSSLLLAAANKRLPSKKSGSGKSSLVGSHKSSSGGHYNFPECTKVQHGKKKSQPMTALNMAAVSEIPILPKGLASCLSITNIPNPVSVPGHMGIHPRSSASPSNSPGQASMKPMPSLKKMVPNKHQSSNNKTTNSKSPKKSNGVSKTKGHNSAYHNPLSSGLTVDSIGGNSMVSPTPAEETDKVEHLSEKALNTKLTTQRLEQERKEHDLRMKLLEKELQAHTYQSQYWSLKLKLLRSGRENAALGFAGATNGDID